MTRPSVFNYIIEKLRVYLPGDLLYHNIDHVLDVYEAVNRISKAESINSETAELLSVAALMHDAGMIISYKGHEAAACKLVSDWLPQFGYDESARQRICGMILTTQLPQSATLPEEQILCDADLDYLGRDDFFMIAERLRLEWKRKGIIDYSLNDWYKLQIDFLGNHNYYTQTNRTKRDEGKRLNLIQIKSLFNQE